MWSLHSLPTVVLLPHLAYQGVRSVYTSYKLQRVSACHQECSQNFYNGITVGVERRTLPLGFGLRDCDRKIDTPYIYYDRGRDISCRDVGYSPCPSQAICASVSHWCIIRGWIQWELGSHMFRLSSHNPLERSTSPAAAPLWPYVHVHVIIANTAVEIIDCQILISLNAKLTKQSYIYQTSPAVCMQSHRPLHGRY